MSPPHLFLHHCTFPIGSTGAVEPRSNQATPSRPRDTTLIAHQRRLKGWLASRAHEAALLLAVRGSASFHSYLHTLCCMPSRHGGCRGSRSLDLDSSGQSLYCCLDSSNITCGFNSVFTATTIFSLSTKLSPPCVPPCPVTTTA